MKSDHHELPTLALNALINLCNHAGDIVLNFVENKGIVDLLEFLKSTREHVLEPALGLVLVLIQKEEENTK